MGQQEDMVMAYAFHLAACQPAVVLDQPEPSICRISVSMEELRRVAVQPYDAAGNKFRTHGSIALANSREEIA